MASQGVLVSCRIRGGVDNAASVVSSGSGDRSVIVQTNSDSLSSGTAPVASSYEKFDAVFPATSTQQEVFDALGAPFIDDVLAGYHCTILTYGQTGSGKTYTTVGGSTRESQGIIPRAIEALLAKMQAIEAFGEYETALTASFIEIYQEKLRDLLLPLNSSRLRLREDKRRGVWIDGAGAISVDSLSTGMALLARGSVQRATGCTAMNTDSSRSHSVLMLTVTKSRKASSGNSGASCSSSSNLFIVDLAGSERAQKTAASGVRLDEAKHINKVRLSIMVVRYEVGFHVRCFWEVPVGAGQCYQRVGGRQSAAHPVPRQQAHAAVADVAGWERQDALAAHLFEQRGSYRRDASDLALRSSCQVRHKLAARECAGRRQRRVPWSFAADPARQNVRFDTLCMDERARFHSCLFCSESLSCYIRELEAARCSACRSRGCERQDPMLDGDQSGHSQYVAPPTVKGDSPLGPAGESESIADSMIQAEMRSLRKALADLAVTTNAVRDNQARQANETESQPTSREEETTSNQRLAELEEQIRQLQAENKQLEAANHSLRADLGRQTDMVRQYSQGDAAEAEILRRRLDQAENRAQELRTELAATLQQHTGIVALAFRLLIG